MEGITAGPMLGMTVGSLFYGMSVFFGRLDCKSLKVRRRYERTATSAALTGIRMTLVGSRQR